MAIATLSLHADKGGTYTVCITCTNDAGGADTPLTLNWTLTDSAGTVINSRSEVNIPTPASTENVEMTDDDWAIQSGETAAEVTRLFTVQGTNSAGKSIRGQCQIVLDNYVALPIA